MLDSRIKYAGQDNFGWSDRSALMFSALRDINYEEYNDGSIADRMAGYDSVQLSVFVQEGFEGKYRHLYTYATGVITGEDLGNVKMQ